MLFRSVITIGREYGSGGREVGKKLALRLGIAFYDRELITRAAKKSGFDEEMFEQLDKRATNSFLYSLTMFGTAGTNGMSLTDQLYLAQANVIRELADMGPCVMVGRCADHVLREYSNRFDFFITGSMDARETRLRGSADYEITGRSIASALEKMDKQRATYYNYYTGQVWGKSNHYDMCINAGRIGVDATVELILDYVDKMKNRAGG